jgi:hypothetical protein
MLSVSLKNWIGSLLLAVPALSFKVPAESTSVKPMFEINGIATCHLKFN